MPRPARTGEAVRAAQTGDLERFPRVTFTVPPDIARLLDTAWRHHENLDGSLCRNKSNYITDLVRRDASKKTGQTKVTPARTETRRIGKKPSR